MEGVGDEVLIFGAATVATAVMLYYAVINFFVIGQWPCMHQPGTEYRLNSK